MHVRRFHALWLAAVYLAVAGAGSAAGQPASVELDATVGLDGWVSGDGPMRALATIEATVLFVGELHVDYGGVTSRLPVEVPAGGSKAYAVPVQPPTGQSSLTVRLVDSDGRQAARVDVRPRVATEEIVVAVDGDVPIAARLQAERTAIDNVPIEAVVVAGTGIDLSPVSYLISADPGLTDQVWSWVDRGGRLITTEEAAAPAIASLTPVRSVSEAGEWYRYGQGEVVVTDLATADWSQLIRPVPIDIVNTDPWSSPGSQLTRAATGASDAELATMSWLVYAILGYAVIVGPVNFLLLRRRGRREWAWVTIPALALVALGVFWFAGRQRLEATTVRHATVSVGQADGYSISSVVLAAGTGGTRTVGVDRAQSIYPVSVEAFNEFGAAGSSGSVLVDGDRVEFQLSQLGVGAVQVRRPALDAPTVEAVVAIDGGLEVTLTNTTSRTIDYWGATVGSAAAVSPRPVEPGDTDSIVVQPLQQFFDPGMGFGDIVVQNLQLWDDERGWQVISPLGGAAAAEIGFGRAAVFAFSNDIDLPVRLDGRAAAVAGPVVYALPLGSGDEVVGLRRVSGSVVAMQDVDFVESYGAGEFIHAASVTMRFRLPPGVEDPVLGIGEGWARPSERFEVYDWLDAVFVPVEAGDPIEVSRFVSPLGEMLVHAFRQGQAEFQGEPIAPGIVTLEWGA